MELTKLETELTALKSEEIKLIGQIRELERDQAGLRNILQDTKNKITVIIDKMDEVIKVYKGK